MACVQTHVNVSACVVEEGFKSDSDNSDAPVFSTYSSSVTFDKLPAKQGTGAGSEYVWNVLKAGRQL